MFLYLLFFNFFFENPKKKNPSHTLPIPWKVVFLPVPEAIFIVLLCLDEAHDIPHPKNMKISHILYSTELRHGNFAIPLALCSMSIIVGYAITHITTKALLYRRWRRWWCPRRQRQCWPPRRWKRSGMELIFWFHSHFTFCARRCSLSLSFPMEKVVAFCCCCCCCCCCYCCCEDKFEVKTPDTSVSSLDS